MWMSQLSLYFVFFPGPFSCSYRPYYPLANALNTDGPY